MSNEQISLHYKEGNSDKVYHLQLVAEGSGYVVNFQYGRRGSSLRSSTKTKIPVTYAKAKSIYDAKVNEQLGEGYRKIASSHTGFTSSTAKANGTTTNVAAAVAEKDARKTGILPQLLNAVDQTDADAYLDDPLWGLQQKFDGDRRLVRVNDTITGINRKGESVGLTQEVADELAALKKKNYVLDAESIGSRIYAFDLLEYRGGNIRNLPFEQRHRYLADLLAETNPNGSVRLAPLYFASSDKRRVFEELRAAGAEGIVFKRINSRYTPGRPASGGDALKVKFWQTASVIVRPGTDGKRSVGMAVIDAAGAMVHVGNVTIPPNQKIPDVGAILDVRYLYAYERGSLFQTTSLRVRDDIDTADCVQSQLVYKSASEIDDASPTP